MSRVAAVEEPEDLERTFGPLLDKLLLRRGIAAIDPGSRTMVLATLRDGLRDALENRKRNAAGDYSRRTQGRKVSAVGA